MEYKDIIRVVSKPKELSIIERTKYIAEKHYLISEYLNKFDWYLFDKMPVDIRQQENISQLILKRIKKRIRNSTVQQYIQDDYVDTTSSIDGFYASKKFDTDSMLTYSIGTNDETTLLIIKKALYFEKIKDFSELKKFILKLVDFFEPKYIEVSDYTFYNDLMNLESDEYRFGWMTYFSKDIKIPQIPSDVKVEELLDGGKLLVITEEFFTCENPEHVRKAKSLVELFRKNNIRC